MKKLLIILANCLFIFIHISAPAYDVNTHEKFNLGVAAMVDPALGDNFHSFLISYLGFELGRNTKIELFSDNKSVQDWLGYGGIREDELDSIMKIPLRVLHHFHNPLSESVDLSTGVNSWKYSGLGLFTYKDLHVNKEGGCIGMSAAVAAQDQANLGCEIPGYEGDWSWRTARKFYYTALTGDSTSLDGFWIYGEYYQPQFFNIPVSGKIGLNEKEKKQFWARTFRAVGQVMHLVHDQAVPAHVRNDRHLPPDYDTYEKVVRKKLHGKDASADWLQIVDQSISTPKVFDKSILTKPLWGNPGGLFSNSSATIPIAWIFDSDIYKESTGPSVTDSLNVGLSEYTNANFFSDDTIYRVGNNFVNEILYPILSHPDSSSECYNSITNGTKDYHGRLRVYYLKNSCGEDNDGNGYLLAAEQYFASWQTEEEDEIGDYAVLGGTVDIILDELVFRDYARLLFPRAIGYSKGLLDYFFRGRMEISPIHPQDLIIRGNGSGGISIFNVTANVRNATMDPDANNNPIFTDENMGGGTLLAVAKYQVAGAEKYSVSKEISIDFAARRIDAAAFTEFQFDFSDQPIPWNASGVDFQVIFQGTLGNEKDLAVAVGRRPLFDAIMAISPPSEYAYSIIDASTFYNSDGAQPQFFNTLKASLRNQTATKEIQTGTLTAIASYRRLKNYRPDMAGATPTPPSERGETITYSISEPISIDPTGNTITSSDSREFILDFSNNPIPAGITDLYLFTVFEGTLHDPATNTDAPDSIVVGIKDLNEPQHLTFWNNTDYFLLQGYPRTTSYILENYPAVEELSYIYPHSITESVAFSGNKPVAPLPALVNFNLENGRYSRIIVMTDASNYYYVSDTVLAPINPYVPPEGKKYTYTFPMMINQLSIDGIWKSSDIFTSRSIKMHDSTYFVNVWPSLYLQSNFPVPDNDLTPVPAEIQFP